MGLVMNAEKAYNESVEHRKNKENLLYRKMIESFNDKVTSAVEQGRMGCLNSWDKFSDEDIFDTDLIDRFLKEVLQAGYDVEFYYKSPSGYNPKGIVVAWGSDRKKEMNDIFKDSSEIYRGESYEQLS